MKFGDVDLLWTEQNELQGQGKESCSPSKAESSETSTVQNKIHKTIMFWTNNVPQFNAQDHLERK